MIDAAIDWRRVIRHGMDVTVEVYPDRIASPRDYECYSESDIAAYGSSWQFVEVLVAVTGTSVTELLSAVEWGCLPGGLSIGMDEIIRDTVPNMIEELAAQLQEQILAMAEIIGRHAAWKRGK